jgi:hypothetical protein
VLTRLETEALPARARQKAPSQGLHTPSSSEKGAGRRMLVTRGRVGRNIRGPSRDVESRNPRVRKPMGRARASRRASRASEEPSPSRSPPRATTSTCFH